MIPAAKREWFATWLARHAERRLARTFERVWVADAHGVKELARTRPVVVVANHSAWWDAMMVLVLSQRHLALDGYALMDAAQLRRLRFFALAGGFGVDREDSRDGVRAIRHAAGLLDRPGRAVWIFPQGSERPLHEPLAFFGGAAHIARLAPESAVVPLGLVYAFGSLEKPCAFAAFGPPIEARGETTAAVEAQREAVGRQVARIQAALSGRGSEDFEPMLGRRPSRLHTWASAALDRVAGRLLHQQPPRADTKLALPPGHPPRSARAQEGGQQ